MMDKDRVTFVFYFFPSFFYSKVFKDIVHSFIIITNPQELSPDQKLHSIRVMPSILEFLGYTYFFGGFLIGPSFNFMEYRRFVNLEMFRIEKSEPITNGDFKQHQSTYSIDNIVHNEENFKTFVYEENEEKTLKLSKYYIPNSFAPAMNKFLNGFFWIACLIFMGDKYSFDWTLSEEFKSIPFLNR